MEAESLCWPLASSVLSKSALTDACSIVRPRGLSLGGGRTDPLPQDQSVVGQEEEEADPESLTWTSWSPHSKRTLSRCTGLFPVFSKTPKATGPSGVAQ